MLTVFAVRGRVLRIKDSKTSNPNVVKDYTLARDCKVTINGEEKGVADIENGDRVMLFNANKDGYHKVEIKRDPNAPVAKNMTDHSKPVTVELPEDGQSGALAKPVAVGKEPGPGVETPTTPAKRTESAPDGDDTGETGDTPETGDETGAGERPAVAPIKESTDVDEADTRVHPRNTGSDSDEPATTDDGPGEGTGTRTRTGHSRKSDHGKTGKRGHT